MIPPLLDKFERLHIGLKSSHPVQARSDSKNLKDVTNLSSTKTGRVILDIFKPKQTQSDARVYAVPARVSTLKFSNNESDSDDLGEETGWEAITIIWPRRYPKAGPGSNPDDFNVNDLSISADPDAPDLKPLTLKSKWLNRLYKLKSAADDPSSCASGQKRPPTDDAKRSKKDKRQRKAGGGDGDGPNGGGGGGGGGGNGRKNNKPPQGHRYPPPSDAVDKFECPFYKYNPVRYQDCRGLCMPRLSDVTQHIDRRHVLKDTVYCPRCRLEFFGTGAEARRDAHLQPRTCPFANIRDSGVILPREYEEIKSALHSGLSRDEKWNKIYEICIARPLPPSPYVETETTRRGRAESTLPEVLSLALQTHGNQIQLIVRDVLDHVFPGSSPATRPLPTDNTAQAPTDNPPPPPPPGLLRQPAQQAQPGPLAPQSQNRGFYPEVPGTYVPTFPGYYSYQPSGPVMVPPAAVQGYPAARAPPTMAPTGTDPFNDPSPNLFDDPNMIQLFQSIASSPQPSMPRSGTPSQFLDQNDDDFSPGPNFMPPSGSNNPHQRYQ